VFSVVYISAYFDVCIVACDNFVTFIYAHFDDYCNSRLFVLKAVQCCPLGEGIHTCEDVSMASLGARVGSGQIDIPPLVGSASDNRL